MATLVLSVVGAVVAGPIGGAVGAIAGQAIDTNLLFKPKGRQGPRLTELAVQTSSYGTPIPQIFGTMRVAGTVIWSTNLIESKNKRGGKGQPGTTSFSYAASFAVLLSARPIAGIRRIWADGKLLRGSDGDFKSATGFRVHSGDEGQAPDPLIAAAEGLTMAPAHRGHAYVVFENFQLADYGNRIPSLTFEVVAEPAPVTLGNIAQSISDGAVLGDAVQTNVTGFSAYGDSVRAVLETLGTAAGAWFAPDDRRLVMRNRANPGVTINDMGVASGQSRGRRGARSVAPIDTVPKTVSVMHYDPARDYQTGLQRSRRPGPGARADRFDLPAAIDAVAAKEIGARALAQAEAGRDRREITLAWSAVRIVPGDTVEITGSPGVAWRVTRWSLEAMVLTLSLVRLESGSAGTLPATSGRVLGNVDVAHGPTILHVFEIPPVDESVLTVPRLWVAAAGQTPGWRRAALLLSTDGGVRWTPAGATAAPATVGVLSYGIRAAPATLRDLATEIDVTLAHAEMSLVDADDAALDAGANLALIGDELVQFGIAEQLDLTRWRLRRLLRGRRGTEAAAGTQTAGDRFVLIERDALTGIDLSPATIGSRIKVLASGIGDTAGPVGVDIVTNGVSVRPPSPAQLRLRPRDGGVRMTWVRRSRGGWTWIDGVDAPLIEEFEAFRIVIAGRSGATRTIDTGSSQVDLPAVDIADPASVAVRQHGRHGESPPATATIF